MVQQGQKQTLTVARVQEKTKLRAIQNVNKVILKAKEEAPIIGIDG